MRVKAIFSPATVLPLVAPFFASFAWGQTLTPPPSPTALEGLVQVVIGLGIVLLAIVGVAWLARRLMPSVAGGGRFLRVVSGVTVGQRERVVVLEIENRWLVIGVATGNVTLLATLDKPPSAPPSVSTPPLAQGAFADKLKSLLTSQGFSLPKKP